MFENVSFCEPEIDVKNPKFKSRYQFKVLETYCVLGLEEDTIVLFKTFFKQYAHVHITQLKLAYVHIKQNQKSHE